MEIEFKVRYQRPPVAIASGTKSAPVYVPMAVQA
jgi:hypothetical protein